MSTPASKRKTLAVAISVLAPLFVAALLQLRETTAVQNSGRHQAVRILSFLDQLDAIPHRLEGGRQLILMLGQSELETGFDPREFDARLQEKNISSLTFNVASRFASSEYFSVMAKIIQAKTGTPKARYLFYSLPLFSSTSTYEHRQGTGFSALLLLRRWIEIEGLPALSHAGFWSLLKDCGSIRFAELSQWNPVSSAAPDASYLSLWQDEKYRDTRPWNDETRGLYRLNVSQQEFGRLTQEFQTPTIKNAIAQDYEQCCGLLSADISMSRIAALKDTYSELSRIAEEVIFIAVPEAPSVLALRSPEAAMRHEILKRLLRKSGITVWDVDAGLAESDYWDGFHLSAQGSEKLYQWLVPRIH